MELQNDTITIDIFNKVFNNNDNKHIFNYISLKSNEQNIIEKINKNKYYEKYST